MKIWKTISMSINNIFQRRFQRITLKPLCNLFLQITVCNIWKTVLSQIFAQFQAGLFYVWISDCWYMTVLKEKFVIIQRYTFILFVPKIIIQGYLQENQFKVVLTIYASLLTMDNYLPIISNTPCYHALRFQEIYWKLSTTPTRLLGHQLHATASIKPINYQNWSCLMTDSIWAKLLENLFYNMSVQQRLRSACILVQTDQKLDF